MTPLAKALHLLFGTIFLYGWILQAGVPAWMAKLAIEVAVGVVAWTGAATLRTREWPGQGWLAAYLVWVVAASLAHGESPIAALLYSRYVLYAYLIGGMVWNAPLPLRDTVRINRFILGLFLLQVAATVWKLAIVGSRSEHIVGSISAFGGENATVFPLFAMGYGLAIYFEYRPRLATLLLTLSFGLISYASRKRGFYFYLPPLLAITFLLHQINPGPARRRLLSWATVGALAVLTIIGGVLSTPSLRGDEANTGMTAMRHAVAYGMEYEGGTSVEGRTTGRSGTSRRVWHQLSGAGLDTALFGWGPGIAKAKGGDIEELDIAYGLTGWSRDAISIGWPGTLFYIGLMAAWWRQAHRARAAEPLPYWRALALGTTLGYWVWAATHFTYGATFALWGVPSFVLAYFTALVASPLQRAIRYPGLPGAATPSSHAV